MDRTEPVVIFISSLHELTQILTVQAMPDNLRHSRRPHGVAVVTDKDDGAKADYDLPDTEKAKAGVVEITRDQDGKVLVDGEVPEEEEDLAAKVGWTSQFGWPHESVLEGESLLDHTTWMEENLPENMFGGKLPDVPLLI